jgi:hypothetical protein
VIVLALWPQILKQLPDAQQAPIGHRLWQLHRTGYGSGLSAQAVYPPAAHPQRDDSFLKSSFFFNLLKLFKRKPFFVDGMVNKSLR